MNGVNRNRLANWGNFAATGSDGYLRDVNVDRKKVYFFGIARQQFRVFLDGWNFFRRNQL